MANSKKKKQKYGNPQKNLELQQQKEQAIEEKQVERVVSEQKSNKPLLARILVIAICAVMVLGIVVGAVLS